MKRPTVRALIISVVAIEIAVAAATTSVAAGGSLPPECSTEIVARCENAPGGSIQCMRTELGKVKHHCRKVLLESALPASMRSD